MRKLFFLTALLCASVMAFADVTKYCEEEKVDQNGNHYFITIKKVADQTYTVILEGSSTATITGTYNINCGMAGGIDMSNGTWEFSNAGYGSLTRTFEYDKTPGVVGANDLTVRKSTATGSGDLLFAKLPTDADWSATCEKGECTDKTAPTISAVSAGEITYNSAVITITAADNDGGSGIARYIIKNGDVQLASSSSNVITLTDLTYNTAYSLSVYVKDECENQSTASSVSFKTESFHYCSFPTGHLNEPNFGDIYGRILLTIKKVDDSTIAVKVDPNNNGTKGIKYMNIIVNGTDHMYGNNDGSGDDLTGFYEISGLASLNNISFRLEFYCNTPNWVVGPLTIAEAELCDDGGTTALDNTEAEVKAIKVIENGQLVIIKNGVKYNALGAELR